MISKSSVLTGLFNLRNHSQALAQVLEKFTGISAKRSLPAWRTDTVWQSNLGHVDLHSFNNANKPVVLWADTFNGAFESENIYSAVRVLEAAGYTVYIPRKEQGHFCCGRTYLATGMIDRAKESARELVNALYPFADKQIPIIGLEPSCILSLRDEFLVMDLGDKASLLAKNSFTFEEFLAQENKAGRFNPNLKPANKPILIHGHCHQKSFDVVKPMMDLLKLIPNAKPELIETSCCGMAGSFGYESEHMDVSMQMAGLQLLPAIEKAPDALLVADGSSCRHQIKDGASRQALHLAQILEMHLA